MLKDSQKSVLKAQWHKIGTSRLGDSDFTNVIMCVLSLSFFGPSGLPKQGAVSSQLYYVLHGSTDTW